ncbi:uroporphyrinogen decarboxylase family protein [Planctomycetota bacterium]
MNTVERTHAALNFEKPDRLPVLEWAAWWDMTLERWYEEGLSRDLGEVELLRHFNLDLHFREWYSPRGSVGHLKKEGTGHNDGITHTMAEYEPASEIITSAPVIDEERLQVVADHHAAGDGVYWLQLDGFFWFPRAMLGIERHLMTFYDDPELMHRMNEDILAYNLRILDIVCEKAVPDLVTVSEDMSYNHGPMLSEDMFNEFIAPYYRRLVPAFQEKGIHVFIDSDGDITPLIPWLQKIGVEGIVPLERMAGVDVNAIRAEHSQWKMIGAYDKTVMHKGEDAIRNEFERLLPVMRSGGFIPSVDHQTPPGVSLDQYRQYLELYREYSIKGVKE